MNLLFGNIGSKITFVNVLCRLLFSIIIGAIIGFERERKNRPAGLRTHVLVCFAATLVAVVEQQMVYEVTALANSTVNISIGRLSVGVISGIGFIGAGTIMMSKSRIVGLTTAASLWCTACLGLVNGMGYCLVALISSLIVIGILFALKFSEKTSLSRIIEIECIDDKKVISLIKGLLEKENIKVHDSSISYRKDDKTKYCTVRYSIVFKDNDELQDIMSKISDIKNVTGVKIQNYI